MNRIYLACAIGLLPLIGFSNCFPGTRNVSDTNLLAGPVKIPIELNSTESVSVNFPSTLESSRNQCISYIEKFSKQKRAYLIQIYNKGKDFFPRVSSILSQYNLPDELKVLIALESGFNGNAVSKAGAVGYWQFMNDVAKEYGLNTSFGFHSVHHKKIKDDRTNFIKSTLAAARYLKDRCRNLNDNLLLIVAAYNCGVGRISAAVRKSGKANASFWDIKKLLPSETRNYVMNFITLNVIFFNFNNFSNRLLDFTAPVNPIINIAEPGHPIADAPGSTVAAE